jgi:hypothetical protein
MDSSESVDLASSLNDSTRSCYRKSLFGSTSNLEGDITSVNHSLVKEGWCWWYRKYAPVIRFWTGGVRTKPARGRKGCGLTRLMCRCGSGEREPVDAANGVDPTRSRRADVGTEGYDGRVYDFLLNLPTMHYCNCLAILHRQPAADGFCPAFTDDLLRSIMDQEGWHGTTAEVFSRVQA